MNELKQYLKEIRNTKLLDKKLERNLQLRASKGDIEAQKALVMANLRLVISFAKQYAGRGLPFADLVQEGNLGLIVAAKKLDPSKKVKFTTYAGWWIKHFMNRAISNKARPIRFPHRKERLFGKIMHYIEEKKCKGEDINLEEVSERFGISTKMLKILIERSIPPKSIDYEDEDAPPLQIKDEGEEIDMDEKQIIELLKNDSIKELTEREKKILKYRYGLFDGKPYSLETIATLLGLSPETVRQTEKKALQKLRRLVA